MRELQENFVMDLILIPWTSARSALSVQYRISTGPKDTIRIAQ